MTDANGREMSNRWDEALVIRQWVLERGKRWKHATRPNHLGGRYCC